MENLKMSFHGTRPKYNGKPNYRKNHYKKSAYYEKRHDHRQRETQDQDDELMALASIYDPEIFHVEEGAYQGHFCAQIELPKPFYIRGVKSFGNTSAEHNATDKEICVEFLPPIILQFRLPNNYPSQQKPPFRLRCNWLNKSQLGVLCSALDKLWNENKYEVVLFRWTEYLKEESLTALDINGCLDLSWVSKDLSVLNERCNQNRRTKEGAISSCNDSVGTDSSAVNRSKPQPSRRAQEPQRHRRNGNGGFYSSRGDPRAIPDHGNLATLVPSLLDYNQMQKERQFKSKLHYCNVCLEEKIGSLCTRFKECGHIYCRECIKSYFEVQIVEGKVKSLTCPYDKCTTQAAPSHVLDLVGEELFAKYDHLLLSTTLDSMTDIQYCPRTFCQCAVVIEPNCTMATCPACSYSFCIFCRMAYHGVESCKMKSEERRLLYERYKNGTEDEKRMLDSRYGRLQMRHLVDLTLSESWVDENSKQCPHCRSNIEKSDGCNKMSCWKCNKYFCWTCMAKLPDADPYRHYEDSTAGCFNRLFTGAFAEIEEDFGDADDDDEDSESDDDND